MRKILISIVGALVFCTAFAAGENIPTSKSYVDAGVAEKQDKISANNGAAQVLTNTGTAGEYGTKNIYNSANTYAGQSDALIDAVTMNTAVQNAIDSEFQCVEYNPNDPTDCWLMDVFGTPQKISPNLFDVSKIPTRSGGTDTKIINNGDGSITVTASSGNSAITTGKTLQYLAPNIVAGNRYVLNFDTTGRDNKILLYCYGHTSDNVLWERRTSRIIPENLLRCSVYFYASGVNTTATISKIQIEEGTTATPYQPYGNIYVPSGN